jgi:alginate O-acetyltransferase complex protein AlgI
VLFNSFPFILILLPFLIAVYQLVASNGARQLQLRFLLFISSCLFIAVADWLSLVALLISVGLNFQLLRLLAATKFARYRNVILCVGIVFNLSYIGVFKYANFLLGTLGFVLDRDFAAFGVTLPLAISFYTFQLIALLVDTWRERRDCPDASVITLFTAFFPQLIAGPIVRFDEVKEDLMELKAIKLQNFASGMSIFAIGLFKKTAIADNLAPFANRFFDAVNVGATPNLLEAWGGALLYTFQIYFDFSGYSDMAIGLALIFGIHLPMNFYSPYKADSIIEFWRRWHITLSRFLRDYLYISLGGNRHGILGRWRNVVITMLLGGLWHGASWNFVLWGGLHGLLISLNHAARNLSLSLPKPIAWGLTFVLIVATWVIFRTSDIGDAERIYAGMLGLNGIVLPERLAPLFGGLAQTVHFIEFGSSELLRLQAVPIIVLAAFIGLSMPNTEQYFREGGMSSSLTVRHAAIAGLAGGCGLFGIHQAVEFVYFRF